MSISQAGVTSEGARQKSRRHLQRGGAAANAARQLSAALLCFCFAPNTHPNYLSNPTHSLPNPSPTPYPTRSTKEAQSRLPFDAGFEAVSTHTHPSNHLTTQSHSHPPDYPDIATHL